MAKIKDLPLFERPREKAVRFGIDTLSNEELLAIILRTGTKEASALDVAHLLNSESRGLYNLFQKPYSALLDMRGIGPGKALVLSACFELSKRYHSSIFYEKRVEDSYDIYLRYHQRLNLETREVLILVVLNRSKQVIHEEVLYKGGEGGVDFRPNEVVKKVIHHNGRYFYIIHNHPSGDCNPSEEDKIMTMNVLRISNRMNVPLLDHIIIAVDGYFSFSSFKKAVI